MTSRIKQILLIILLTLLINYFLYKIYGISRESFIESPIEQASVVRPFLLDFQQEAILNNLLDVWLQDPNKRKELLNALCQAYPKETKGLSFYDSYGAFIHYGLSIIRIDFINWSIGIVFSTETSYSNYKARYLKKSNNLMKVLIISLCTQNQLDLSILDLLITYLDEFNKNGMLNIIINPQMSPIITNDKFLNEDTDKIYN